MLPSRTSNELKIDFFYLKFIFTFKYFRPSAPVQPMKTLPSIERAQQSPPSLSQLPWTIPDTESSPEFMNFNIDYDNRGSRSREKLLELDLLKSEKESEKDELCIDATGIIVAIVTFLVLQIIIAIIWTQFWQKKKKRNSEKQIMPNHVFNPYAVTTSRN
jgi:hypothetical protein